jgi:hypothetical protein
LWSMGGNNKKFKKKCVCCLARQIGVWTSSAWKTCHSDLSLCVYKLYLSQPLLEDRVAGCYAFVSKCGVLLCLECHMVLWWSTVTVTLTSKMSDFGLKRI